MGDTVAIFPGNTSIVPEHAIVSEIIFFSGFAVFIFANSICSIDKEMVFIETEVPLTISVVFSVSFGEQDISIINVIINIFFIREKGKLRQGT